MDPTIHDDADRGGRGAAEQGPLELITEGFLSVRDGSVTSVNGSAVELLGVEREQLLERDFEAALGESNLVGAVQSARETGEAVDIEGHDEATGAWLAGTAHPTPAGVSVVFRDVSVEKELESRVEESESALERLHDIAADTDLSTDEKIDRLLQVGVDRLDTATGFLTRIQDGIQEIRNIVGAGTNLERGSTAPLSEAYCRYTIGRDEPVVLHEASAEGWADDPAYERFGLECYLGANIRVDDEDFGTVCFVDPEPRERQFTERELTFAELLTDWIHYLLEQQEYQRELEGQQAFMESLFDCLPDPLYAFDGSGDLIRWNDRVTDVTGYSDDELSAMSVTDFIAPRDRQRVEEAFSAVLDGQWRSVEARMLTSDGTHQPYEFSSAPMRDETGAIEGAVGIGRNISAQLEHQERLSGILDTTRSLMQARDRQHVADIAVSAAQKLLGFDLCAFRLYDGGADTLVPAASTEAAKETLGERPVYAVGEGFPGEVFASGEPSAVADLRTADTDLDLGPARSAMYHPVGVHGTLSVCSTEPDAFDETDEQMLALLATSAAAACMRANREQEVREAREHTERILDRVNGLVENTIECLVESTTRDELEGGVVDEIATADPYSYAMIGRPDVTGEWVEVSAAAGDGPPTLSEFSFELGHDDEPVSLAYETGEVQVREDVAAIPTAPWPDVAAETAVRALIVLPLTYKDATYGVLTVLAEDASALDERERIVLDALGRASANAINAIERGRILDATEIIELEFAIDDRDLLLSRLSASGNCTIETAGTEYKSDGQVSLYLSATEVDPGAFMATLRDDDEVLEVTCIVEHESECLVEVVLAESILTTLTEHGAVPQAVTAENGTVRFTVELPYEAEARELFELVEGRYPTIELMGYHERERAMETRQEFTAALSERLTDRQETALRTAYLGGFFDWPREVDGNELAEAMDISRPTYHQHLRAAQGKVFEELFE